jgi:hypothetical protein
MLDRSYKNLETDMETAITQAAVPATWATMTTPEKWIFAGKVGIMLCSFGYIFGGALVEGMVYADLGKPVQ